MIEDGLLLSPGKLDCTVLSGFDLQTRTRRLRSHVLVRRTCNMTEGGGGPSPSNSTTTVRRWLPPECLVSCDVAQSDRPGRTSSRDGVHMPKRDCNLREVPPKRGKGINLGATRKYSEENKK